MLKDIKRKFYDEKLCIELKSNLRNGKFCNFNDVRMSSEVFTILAGK